jgi:outer membrane protein assembly factor BamB
MKKYIAILIILCFYSCENITAPQSGFNQVKVVWSHAIPERPGGLVYLGETQPLIENNKVYVVSDTSCTAYNLKVGNILWRRALGNVRVISALTIPHDEDKIFINHVDFVKAFRKSDGQLLWTTTLEGLDWVHSKMIIGGSSLYLGQLGKVIRLNKQSGQIDLTIPLDSLSPDTVFQQGRGVAVSESDKRLYVGTGYYIPGAPATSGNIFCFDAITGQCLWAYRVPNRRVTLYTPSGTPFEVEANRAVYGVEVGGELVVCTIGQEVLALNRFTGQVVWSRFFMDDAFCAGLTISGNRIYIGAQAEPGVHCLDLMTGATIWKTKLRTGSINDILTVKDGKVYFCVGMGGEIFVLSANNGRLIWNGKPPEASRDRDASFISNLAVGEGYMVNVGSKKVYCLTSP